MFAVKSSFFQRSSLLNQVKFAWKHSTPIAADRIAHSFVKDNHHDVRDQIITINVLDSKGYNRKIKAKIGTTLFEALQNHDLFTRVDPHCDQSTICAACHVIISNEWYNKLPQTSDYEQMSLSKMYAPVEKLTPNSRLACQIKLDKEYDGIVVAIQGKDTIQWNYQYGPF